MAYPASTKTLRDWVKDIDRIAIALKGVAEQQKALSLAGTLNIDIIRRFFDQLVQTNIFFTQAAAVSGIGAYINSEKQGQVANAVTEFQAMQTQVVATLDWLRANVPSGVFQTVSYKLGFVFPAGNVTPSTPITFTAALTAGYRTVLDALIATVG